MTHIHHFHNRHPGTCGIVNQAATGGFYLEKNGIITGFKLSGASVQVYNMSSIRDCFNKCQAFQFIRGAGLSSFLEQAVNSRVRDNSPHMNRDFIFIN
jgi:hypothetical protein